MGYLEEKRSNAQTSMVKLAIEKLVEGEVVGVRLARLRWPAIFLLVKHGIINNSNNNINNNNNNLKGQRRSKNEAGERQGKDVKGWNDSSTKELELIGGGGVYTYYTDHTDHKGRYKHRDRERERERVN